MVDPEWLRHLAGADYAGGRWTHADPEAVLKLAADRVTQAVQRLEDEALAACQVLNDFGRRQVRLLRLAAQPGRTLGGFTLLCGRTQLTVEAKDQSLAVTLITMRGFQRLTRELYRLRPHVDPFGSLAWSADNALLMTEDLIIKRLFEDLTRAACEAGDSQG